MTREEEAIKLLNELYIRADITDEYGGMEDMQPYEEAVDMAIKALEKEPCEDAISRQAVINAIANTCFWLSSDNWEELIKCINSIPPTNPQEPKMGHWIKYGIPRCGEQHYKCTNCDEYINFGLYSDYYKKTFKFCPNCGAKMIETQESEG